MTSADKMLNWRLPFHTRFRALLWKEWRESRRPFIGSIFLFIVIPGALGFIYYLITGYSDSLYMGIVGLAILAAGPVAAIWGAHPVCRDLATHRAGFLLARPTSSRSVLAAKSLMSIFLFATICVIGLGYVNLMSDGLLITSIRELVEILFYFLALITVWGISFAAAVTLRRLVPAILMGLVATVLLILVPWYYFDMHRGNRESALITLGSQVVLPILCTALLVALIKGWKPDGKPATNRSIAWLSVVVFLCLVAGVAGSLGSNTMVVSRFGTWPAEILDSHDDQVFWISYGPYKGVPAAWINRTRIGSDGQVRETRQAPLIGGQVCNNYELQDKRTLLVVSSDSKQKNPQLWHFDLDFQLDEIRGELIGSVENLPTNGWVKLADRYYAVLKVNPQRWILEAYESRGNQLHAIAEAPYISADWVQPFLVGGELRLMAQHVDTVELFRHYVVDLTDPNTIKFSSVSDVPMSDQVVGVRVYGNSYFAANGNRMALASNMGIGTSRFGVGYTGIGTGQVYFWNDFKFRRAGLIEGLAGRDRLGLRWRDDRLYEFTNAGLSVFDTSGDELRRIGHVGTWYFGQIAPLDSRHFVVPYLGGLEVHRLPE